MLRELNATKVIAMGTPSEMDSEISPVSPMTHTYDTPDQIGDCSELYATQAYGYDNVEDAKDAKVAAELQTYVH